ncbi:hypothetical protein DE146DRAFT_642002 [Phaeosphaeria sp. MPI-PUGE-AT-0046c]|nr:hypothetical protein DE146DRAFT_642002 [Phaeosphaeria sp. MPI-PUGE-AT-0046c]
MWTAAQGRFGLLSFSVCCFAALLPCFILDGWRSLPLLIIWAFGAAIRWHWGDAQIMIDCLMFGIGNALWERRAIQEVLAGKEWGATVSAGSRSLISRLVGPLALLACLFRWRANRKNAAIKELPNGVTPWTQQHPKARIFPCQTKHARMFPKRHAFEYTYLQCGFPIIPAGIRGDGEKIGDGDSRLGSWWLQIKADDYLTRGISSLGLDYLSRGDDDVLGFYNKLKLYLREQHVDDADWSYAYLVTAPRFFGYAFNPVSFWYIYDSENQLTKMILEVNNTFGERRMYLLDGSNVSPGTPPVVDIHAPEMNSITSGKSRFTDMWMKDFHVSPFNSRKGSYVLKAQNPFPNVAYDAPVIDNTITLISSKNHAKLVARLNSTGSAIDMESMDLLQTARFVASWWWVGLLTFPRIVKEAAQLFYKRSLHVWFRPEVAHTSIGRSPTSTEIELYRMFKEFIWNVVQHSREPFRIMLHTAIPNEPLVGISKTHIPGQTRPVKELELRVLTPAFYSRFAHYAYISEALNRECVFTDEKNRTLWMSRPELLPLLLEKSSSAATQGWPTVKRSWLGELRWTIMRKLRCAPAPQAYDVPRSSNAQVTMEDVRSLPFSELDEHARSFRAHQSSGQYRRIVTKLFLAQRFTLGFTEVIGILDLLVRLSLTCLGLFQLVVWRARMVGADIPGFSTKAFQAGSWDACFKDIHGVHGQWWWLLGMTAAVSACHMYGVLKGYK